MPAKKFAISIPEDVMRQVDRAAATQGVTRSRFIAKVLQRVASARTDAEVTRRLNRVFADPEIEDEQRATAQAFELAAPTRGLKW
jgi:metal-responsive CopG/Arc/MetJ family transcriptional regulator